MDALRRERDAAVRRARRAEAQLEAAAAAAAAGVAGGNSSSQRSQWHTEDSAAASDRDDTMFETPRLQLSPPSSPQSLFGAGSVTLHQTAAALAEELKSSRAALAAHTARSARAQRESHRREIELRAQIALMQQQSRVVPEVPIVKQPQKRMVKHRDRVEWDEVARVVELCGGSAAVPRLRIDWSEGLVEPLANEQVINIQFDAKVNSAGNQERVQHAATMLSRWQRGAQSGKPLGLYLGTARGTRPSVVPDAVHKLLLHALRYCSKPTKRLNGSFLMP